MAIGAIQAFIFALLTVLYFGMASGEGHSDEHDEHEQVTEDVPADAPDRSPQPELVA
jgi:F-type H+-transporting ATPase subunit a